MRETAEEKRREDMQAATESHEQAVSFCSSFA